MNEQREFDLLADIAKLIKKHGPDAFERLAGLTSSPEFAERLTTVLTASATVAKASRPKGTPKISARDFRASLVKLSDTEPEKSQIITKFFDDLVAKSVLPTSEHIKRFSADIGTELSASKTRNEAIIALTQSLLPLPLEQLAEKFGLFTSTTGKDDRSLEGWSNIILNLDRRTTTKADTAE